MIFINRHALVAALVIKFLIIYLQMLATIIILSKKAFDYIFFFIKKTKAIIFSVTCLVISTVHENK